MFTSFKCNFSLLSLLLSEHLRKTSKFDGPTTFKRKPAQICFSIPEKIRCTAPEKKNTTLCYNIKEEKTPQEQYAFLLLQLGPHFSRWHFFFTFYKKNIINIVSRITLYILEIFFLSQLSIAMRRRNQGHQVNKGQSGVRSISRSEGPQKDRSLRGSAVGNLF